MRVDTTGRKVCGVCGADYWGARCPERSHFLIVKDGKGGTYRMVHESELPGDWEENCGYAGGNTFVAESFYEPDDLGYDPNGVYDGDGNKLDEVE